MQRMRAARKAAVRAILEARSEMMDQKITDMYELLDSIEAVIEAADPAKRKALAQTIDAFAEDFPEDFSGLSARRRRRSCTICCQ
jgi:hypothetical protein